METTSRSGRRAIALPDPLVDLRVLGVPHRAVMDIMGWSHISMTLRYQHLSGQVRRDIARQVGGLLWGSNETRNETNDDPKTGAKSKDADR